MSKFRYLMLTLVLLIGCLIPIQSTVKAEEYYSFDSGLNIKGRTLLPMRSLFESLGATVDWNQQTKTVTATKDQNKIVLTIGSKQTKVNGKTITIDVPALVIDGSTYVPVRFVTESLGAEVDWDPYFNIATIYYEDTIIDIEVSPAINVSGVEKKFRPNPSYTYVYIPYEGRDTQTFAGMKGNTYVWNSQYTYVETYPVQKLYYTEHQYGLYVTRDHYGEPSTTRLLKYPIYVGQSWETEEYGEYTTRTIINVGSTVKTRVKTFNNVVEVMDEDGMIYYYAEDFGLVEAEHSEVDYGTGLVELKKR